MSELAFGQLAAVALGVLFFLGEFIRLKSSTFAALEGARFWSMIAASELTVWLALGNADGVMRIGIAAIAPILAAIVVNNVYLIAHRKLTKD